jgi:quercetin dioxygenase-like cupin family protein
MFSLCDQLESKLLKEKVLLQRIGEGKVINAVHWDFEDGAIIDLHQHPQEQFGYIIQGGLEVTIGDETALLQAGDAYFIPPNVPHRFVAIGVTEAIDVFTPIRVVG